MTQESHDERDVKSLYDMLKETWKNPFEFTSETLCCISTGVIPSVQIFNIKKFFSACDKECWKVTSTGSTKIYKLSTAQDEADTRMFLYLKMAELEGYQNVVITSKDNGVFVLGVCVASVSNVTISQKHGTAARSWFVNIPAISNSTGSGLSKCLPGLHAYTSHNTVSAFAGKGKLKSWKLIQKEEKNEDAFSTLGTEEKVSSSFNY